VSREKVTCRGSLALGTGCRRCERCEQERARMSGTALAQAKVDAWNKAYKVGVTVEYRKDDDSIVRTVTRSRAEVHSGHTAVIWLVGVRGCVDLDRVTRAKRERQDYKVAELKGKVMSLKKALFMAAANCQGGSSEAGARVAAALGVPFPVRMEALREAAIRDGFDPKELWPWWSPMQAKAS
jgi:hypothetical protein